MPNFVMAIHEDLPGEGIGKFLGAAALVTLAYLGIRAAKSYYDSKRDNKREIQHEGGRPWTIFSVSWTTSVKGPQA